ncbi:lactate utilization protein [Desulfonatronum lacustre]|uniref:lactate utilization protein n=1 Tax=Desulfonatronum lacustre TaxID=66849 RepID=UPI00048CC61C|nr:lactate utilization protein [Desulfonatronum lacustre]
MSDYLTQFWNKRLHKAQEGLESNNFETYLVENLVQARETVLNVILPAVNPEVIAWGGSVTFSDSGIMDALKQRKGLKVLDTSDPSLNKGQKQELRRQALLCDLYFTGTNALTESGQLINLDMYGNRVGALVFGPRHVVVLVGRNKLCVDVEEAMLRVKGFVAPANAARLKMKTPCVKTGFCEDCKSPERICNTWTITEKSFPKGRIKVVLVNEDLGL